MSFVELLGKSSFSFLRGASQPDEMVTAARALGHPAFALCDRDGLYGVVRAFLAAKSHDFPLIVGAELSLAPRGFVVTRYDEVKVASKLAEAASDRVPTIALLVQSSEGYENLCRLLTRAHAALPKGEAVLELQHLAEHSRGLQALVPVPGVDAEALKLSHSKPAQRLEDAVLDWSTLQALSDIFSDRLHLAAFRRLDGLDAARQHWVERVQSRLSLGVVASGRPLFHSAERKVLADVLFCIRNGVTLAQAADRLQINAEARLRSSEQMFRLFRDQPGWVQRTLEVADSCQFQLNELRYSFPCDLPAGVSADDELARLSWQHATRRYPSGIPQSVCEQLRKELEVIRKLQVSPYFLSTFEVVEIARSKGILCQGRGSAANSAVCYVLGLTAVDPVRSNLLFERFLSAERNEPPDIDVDFEHERREEVIQEIYRRYGRDRAAMVSEVISYRGKSALREVGKVFGLSAEQIDRLTGALTHWDDVETCAGRLQELGFDAHNVHLQQVLTLARALQRFPRHLSIHVGGFVLSARPLYEVAPIEPARRLGRSVVPWDKDDLDALGFFKIDVLGLGMLTAIRKALQLIHRGSEPFVPLQALADVPAEDPAAYTLASTADTVGIFQIESRAQMAMLPRLRPQCFYDLVIEVALVRPGPIQGGMVHPYLRRRNGEEAITMPHRDLSGILERTLGVPLFQEQVMQLAIDGAGYSGGDADQLRRDMAAWRKTGRLLQHRERLLRGFAQKGVPEQFAARLFEQIKGFGEYGFPESHAASFALLVYVSLWLKAHHPAELTCALINSQPMGFYSPRVLLRDAQRHGVQVLPIEINRSDWDCTIECGSLRLGFRLLKGFAETSARQLMLAREERPFHSVDDFVWRGQLDKRQRDILVEAGALVKLESERRQALWQLGAPRVTGLFTGLSSDEPRVPLPTLDSLETLMLDYRHTGVSLTDHPLLHLRPQLKQHQVLRACELQSCKTGDRVRVAGLVQSRQRPATASGVVFVTLEDETGVSNLVLFSRVFEQQRTVAQYAMLMLAEGKVEIQLTAAKPGQVGEATPVIHLIVERLQRLELDRGNIPFASRDFH